MAVLEILAQFDNLPSLERLLIAKENTSSTNVVTRTFKFSVWMLLQGFHHRSAMPAFHDVVRHAVLDEKPPTTISTLFAHTFQDVFTARRRVMEILSFPVYNSIELVGVHRHRVLRYVVVLDVS